MSEKNAYEAGDAVSIGRSRSRLAQGFVLGGALLVASLIVVLLAGTEDRGTLWAVGLLVVFGLVVLVQALRAALDPAPWLVIDRQGVWYKEWGLPPVPWAEIEKHYQTGSRLQAYLALALRDQESYFAALAQDRGTKVRFGRLIRPKLLLIPANTLDASFRQIQDAMSAFAAAAEKD
ncbi:MAG: hypothetical protein AAF495_21475 [Pseudomonadota bacterium]